MNKLSLFFTLSLACAIPAGAIYGTKYMGYFQPQAPQAEIVHEVKHPYRAQFVKDKVILKAGGEVEGMIVHETSSEVALDVDGGVVTFRPDELSEIIRTSDEERKSWQENHELAEKLGLILFRDEWMREQKKQNILDQERDAYLARTNGQSKPVTSYNNVQPTPRKKAIKLDMYGRDIEKVAKEKAAQEKKEKKEKEQWLKKMSSQTRGVKKPKIIRDGAGNILEIRY